jgi:Ca2+-binding RTX toxin-like protein
MAMATVRGSPGDHQIVGDLSAIGSRHISAWAGDDLLVALGGDDVLFGGADEDRNPLAIRDGCSRS